MASLGTPVIASATRAILLVTMISSACARNTEGSRAVEVDSTRGEEGSPGADAVEVTDGPAFSLTSDDAPSPVAITRAQLVGEIEIISQGGSEFLRLCDNGLYVRFSVCGGYTRGKWSLVPDGLAFAPHEACLVKGVAGTERGGADAACVYYKRYELLGCMPAQEGLAVAKRERIEPFYLDDLLSDDSLQMIFTGARDTDGSGMKIHHTPEPRMCDPRYRPRTVRDAYRPVPSANK